VREILHRLESTLPSLSDWLYQPPYIDRAIIWEDETGAHPWHMWSAARKAELNEAFERAWLREPIPVAEIPPNQLHPGDHEQPSTVLSVDDAWSYFKASVAQTLALELGGGWAPDGQRSAWWSIKNFSAEQLAQLIDSREMFRWNASPTGYKIDRFYHGSAVPAPSWYAYAFMARNDLIGETQFETLGRVIRWCMDNLVHFFGSGTASNMEDIWQYRGWPPLVRVVQGTVQTSDPSLGHRHFSAGCWGTVGFLRALLRSVNIPVKLVSPAGTGHAQPWFMVEGLYLSHGDDPYGYPWAGVPPVPGKSLLIDQSTWDAWFNASLSDDQRTNNISRQVIEVVLYYLPNYLLRGYCRDIATGAVRGQSDFVYKTFAQWYTLDQVEAMGLWDRLDAKVASFGGCANVPPPGR
jgi:hypothetical protein